MITERARAKINLALHVTGQRDDGYHLLDSLVVFADIGDRLDISKANITSLTVEGPQAEAVPGDMSNSILQAAQLFEPQSQGTAFTLTKTLPSAAGIGGGSADAAAALRGLTRLWGDKTPEQLFAKALDPSQLSDDACEAIVQKVQALGADVPVCLFSRTARMRGIGEQIRFLDGLPTLHAVLVNPGVAVPTPQVFKAITEKDNPGLPEEDFDFDDDISFVAWLAEQRNDMEKAACGIAPVISDVLAELEDTEGCSLARMSGSGATCFGLYATRGEATGAAARLIKKRPNWWVKRCKLGG